MAKKTRKKPRLTVAAADKVASKAVVADISLLGCEVRAVELSLDSPPPTMSTSIRFKTSCEPTKSNDGDTVQVLYLHGTLEVKAKEDADADTVNLYIQCEYSATYTAAVSRKYTENELLSYSKFYALQSLWPYYSEFVRSTTARMGLPALRLPLYEKIGLDQS